MGHHFGRSFLLLGLVVTAAAFGSSDERFLKKYAMMKIYESCFGADVVKEIRQEMKAACAKCAMPVEQTQNNVNNNNNNVNNNNNMNSNNNQPQQAIYVGRLPPSAVYPTNNPAYNRLGEQESNNDLQQNNYGPPGMIQPIQEQSGIDTEKLQQAIMAFRPQQAIQSFPQPNYGFRGSPFAGPLFQPAGNSFYQPWGAPQYPAPFPQPYFQQQQYPFYGQRMSREMDFRSKLEALTARTSGKVRNVTCVMQELGYLDHNLEPNYEMISARIANLPVSKELKSDMQDGLEFCQQFAQCVPETKKENSPLSRELIKPMFFFRCYKHKKLEACVMKDVRERFSSDEDLDGDADFRSMSRVGRGRSLDEGEDVAATMYDFLYGQSELELDSLV